MGILDEIQEGWERYSDWLGSIGQTLSETWGQLAQAIMAGLTWIGSKIKDAFEWIYKGLVWLGDKLKEAYEILAEYVNTGLQWLGAGFSWLGANFYKLGHWIYNGIVVFWKWVITSVKAVLNWFGRVLSSIWNGLCSLPSAFVGGFNDFINDFALGLRGKFKSLVFVNTTIPIMTKQIERIPERMSGAESIWGIVGAVIAPFVTPLATMVLAETMDSMIPRPASKKINILPPMVIPEIFIESLTMDAPDEELDPEMVMPEEFPVYETPGTIPYTAAGYVPKKEQGAGIGMQYDVKLEYGMQASKICGLKTEYEVTLV